jgi:hypothetical protein
MPVDNVEVPFKPEILSLGPPEPEQVLQIIGILKAKLTVMVLTVQGFAVPWLMFFRSITGATTFRGHPPPSSVDGVRGNGPPKQLPWPTRSRLQKREFMVWSAIGPRTKPTIDKFTMAQSCASTGLITVNLKQLI